jgi:hypothetical protein
MTTFLKCTALDKPFNFTSFSWEQINPGDEISVSSIEKSNIYFGDNLPNLEVTTNEGIKYIISEESFKNNYIYTSDYPASIEVKIVSSV